MQPLVFLPQRVLWAPTRHTIIPATSPRLPFGARRNSGDTLATFKPQQTEPPATNYAALFWRNAHWVLAFNDTTQQACMFADVMPKNYAGGNLVVSARWMAAATSGTVGWDVAFERMNAANHDLDTDAFATAQTITATTTDTTSGKVTKTSVTVTAGANTDSIALGEDFRIRVRRDVANDNAVGDAHLLSVVIEEA